VLVHAETYPYFNNEIYVNEEITELVNVVVQEAIEKELAKDVQC